MALTVTRPLAALLPALLVAPACGLGAARVVATDVLADDIRDAVVADYGIEARSVECPSSVRAESGTTFHCDAELVGGTLTFDVRLADDDGGMAFQARDAVVDTERAEGRVALVYQTEIGRNVDVVCSEDPVIVVAVDEAFTCTSTGRGSARKVEQVTVTVLDLDGRLRIELPDGTSVTESSVTPLPETPEPGPDPQPDDAGEGDDGDDGQLPGEELPGE